MTPEREALLARLRDEVGIEHAVLQSEPSGIGIKPLRLTCFNTSCGHDRHLFNHVKGTRPIRNTRLAPVGVCAACAEEVIDAEIIGQQRDSTDPDDIAALVAAQQRELMRAHYWRAPFDQRAYNQALRAGRAKLHEKAAKKIVHDLTTHDHRSLMRASYHGEVIDYAQHATATCCIECAAVWYGLPLPGEGHLGGADFTRLIEVATTYLDLRLPNLPEFGSHVPGIPRVLDDLGTNIIDRLDVQLIENLDQGVDPAGLTSAVHTQIKVLPVRGSGTTGVRIQYDPYLFESQVS